MSKEGTVKQDKNNIKNNYLQVKSLADRFIISLRDQFENLISTNSITLGVPLEYRVKSLESITNNIERNKLSLKSVIELDDLIGIRLILLFKRDIEKIHNIMTDTFDVIRYEDTSSRLTETQFGYQSVHYVVKIPKTWLKVPSFKGFSEFKAEVQIRTLAQHIWAATSHVLQYKQEASVPPSIMRSIYRVSAILELIDFEFERILVERETYISKVDTSQEGMKLNVDLVQSVLDELLPAENKAPNEQYNEILKNLLFWKIDTIGKLRQLIQSNIKEVLKTDKNRAKKNLKDRDSSAPYTIKRAESGIFFIHVGLVREAMYMQFGDEFRKYMIKIPIITSREE